MQQGVQKILVLLTVGALFARCSGNQGLDGNTDAEQDSIEEDTLDIATDVDSENTDTPEFDSPVDPYPDPIVDSDDPISDVEFDGEVPCDERIGVFVPGVVVAVSEPDRWTIRGFFESSVDVEPNSRVHIESWWWEGGPSTPGTTTISGWIPRSDCSLCIYFWQECSSSTGCAHTYMADEATLDITDITMGLDGSIDAVLSNVVFLEWDFPTDTLVTGGVTYCIDRWDISTDFD